MAITVSDRLRVRSLPEVSDTSIKYEPLLPLGTELLVVRGPVHGSGYRWYEVKPISLALNDRVEQGWVAMADKNGEPWIALANQPIAGLNIAMSAITRAPADRTAASDAADSVASFGLELYRELFSSRSDLPDGNVVYSPTSIALALGLARLGARGETGSQIDDVLTVRDQSDLEAGLNALDQALTRRGGAYTDDQGVGHELTLRIANASFAQRDWTIEAAYLDAIAASFGAGVNLVDYASDPETARHIINAWVSQRTARRIPELLEPSDVSPMTRLYLVNAVYLKAAWVLPFPKEETAARPFTRRDGSAVTVPTMHLRGGQEVPILERDGWRATELRYGGPNRTNPLAMMLILPDDMATFEAAMDGPFLRALGSDLTAERSRIVESVTYSESGSTAVCGIYPYSVDVALPRFSIETRAKLSSALASLGMPLAFDPVSADFRAIHQPEFAEDNIYISAVIHQANIDVDEAGTEAAAATAIGMDTGGCTGPAPAEHIEFRLDHPFLFAIRDVETGAILFMGRIEDPSIGR